MPVVLGIKIDDPGFERTICLLENMIQAGKPCFVVTLDALGLERTTWDREYRRIVEKADLRLPDGKGVLLGAMFYGERISERVSGCDLAEGLFRLADEKRYRIFLYGSTPETLSALQKRIRREWPGVRLAGAEHGFQTPFEEKGLPERIKKAEPHILMVALGVPKQEKFIAKHFEKMAVPVSIGVGGSFDVISGLKKRAPLWMQKIGLEWFFRLWNEPSRINKMIRLPVFFFKVFVDSILSLKNK